MKGEKLLKKKIAFISNLNEVERRRYAGIIALEIGWGGVSRINELSGMSRSTIKKGMKEVEFKDLSKPLKRLRKVGGGRKKIKNKNPSLVKDLEIIMDEHSAGNPMNHLKWILKSTRSIANELQKKSNISYQTVRRLLKEKKYSLKGNRKSKEGKSFPERNEQFKYINKKVEEFKIKSGPVISVDTKKKELVGNFKNFGRKWSKKGEFDEVNVYDFPSLAKGKAIPYGTYDVHKNKGFVNVGVSSDTGEFAVESIKRWWNFDGKKDYPKTKKILICADGGGSNGSRNKSWKFYLQKLSNKMKLKITVCHYPPGTSKWNKIEHRMFSFISMNWKAKPLINYETIIGLINGTKTKKGLTIKAKLDKRKYMKGKKISDVEMAKLNIKYDNIHPKWNYTISPQIE